MLRTQSIVVAKPGKLINMNDRPGNHYARNGQVHVWKDAAFWWAKQHRLRCRCEPGELVEVWVEFGTDRPNQRRDPHNFFPTVKGILDGFTLALVWTDDDSKHVRTVEPAFVTDVPSNSLRITLTWNEKEE